MNALLRTSVMLFPLVLQDNISTHLSMRAARQSVVYGTIVELVSEEGRTRSHVFTRVWSCHSTTRKLQVYTINWEQDVFHPGFPQGATQ